MSIHDELTATIDSFWEIGKYSRTVKRSDNGYKLCDNLRQLIEQRAEIEKGYSKSLLAWTKKWNEFLDKGMLLYMYIFAQNFVSYHVEENFASVHRICNLYFLFCVSKMLENFAYNTILNILWQAFQ
jgi:hypothetical protein